MSALPQHKYTLEEYLELDKHAEEKYEFFGGEVFAMAGGSIDHSTIAANVITALNNKLAGRPCRVLTSDARIKVPAAFPYRYPDAVVACGDLLIEEMQGQQMLVNPVLIVEVLSPTTAAYDHGEKFLAYQSIASFREYLLIAPEQAHVTLYVRQTDSRWLRSDITGLGASVTLEALGVTLTLADIYGQISFPSLETK